MESNVLYFYALFFAILISASGIIFTPRMYMALISLLCLICFSSLLYLTLNAQYIAIFQLILCGLFLCAYIFILLKKIGRTNLKLKLVSPFKISVSVIVAGVFSALCWLFFKEEFNNSLYDIFNFVIVKSTDVVKFSQHLFPLHIVLLLVFVTAAVLKIFLEKGEQQ